MATNKKTTTKPVVEEVAVEIPVEEVAKAEPITALVVPDKLNFRKAAATDAEVISVIEKDTKVKLTGKVEGDWSEIKVGNKTGFVMTQFIQTV